MGLGDDGILTTASRERNVLDKAAADAKAALATTLGSARRLKLPRPHPTPIPIARALLAAQLSLSRSTLSLNSRRTRTHTRTLPLSQHAVTPSPPQL